MSSFLHGVRLKWFTTKISSWKSSKLAYLRLFDKKNEEGRKKPIGGRLKFSLRMFLRILLKYSLFISFYFIFDTIYLIEHTINKIQMKFIRF